MDNKDMKEHSGCGDCGSWSHGTGMGMCGHTHWAHIVIKIFVAIFIFWAGVQFGELKGMIRAEYSGSGYGNGYGMMGSYDGRYFGPGMMGGWIQTVTSTSTPTRK